MDARSKGIDSRFSEDVKIVNKGLNKITFDNFKKSKISLTVKTALDIIFTGQSCFLRYISITITVTF
ncbi:predicted protein [Enterococcus faecium 1,230,933]|nr:predicted protein [Enterococcus faecium 1,230,933]